MSTYADSLSFSTAPAQWARFASARTNAFRTQTVPGGWCERLGEDLLISHKDAPALEELLVHGRGLPQSVGFSPRRIFARHLPVRNEERVAPVLAEGEGGLALEGVVLEAGVRYGVDFNTGYSAGLFLDQRLNRARVRQGVGRRMLNTFAYTCSFSVCAALSGAETLSIDLSRKSLARGEANFALNGLDPVSHRFWASDVREALPRLARRGESFDTIILDPPTFSTSRTKGRFRVEDDLEDLVFAVLDVAAPDARILVSTNCTRIGERDVERLCRNALKARRRTGSLSRGAPLEDFPPGAGASAVWVELRG